MVRYLLFLSFIFKSLVAWAQVPIAQFDLSKSVYCSNERLDISNTSINATSYSWDFCPEDIGGTEEVIENLVSIGGDVRGFKLVRDGSNYYGFAVASNNSLYRLEFGTSLENVPTVFDLGNLGVLSSPEGIDIQKEGNEWVGFVGYALNGGDAERLVWTDLSSTPTVETIGSFGLGGRIRDLQLIKTEGNSYLQFPYYNGGPVYTVDYGTSFKNNPGAGDINSSGSLANVSLPISSQTLKVGSNWLVVIASQTSKTLNVYDYGTDLTSVPTEVTSQSFASLGNLEKIKVVEQLSRYYAILSSSGQRDVVIDLKELASTDVFEKLGYTTLPDNYGHDIYKHSGKYYSLGGGSNLNRVKFEQVCDASIAYSEEFEPIVNYGSSGEYDIILFAFDENAVSDFTTKSITVSTNTAPDIDFSSSFPISCVNNTIDFTSINNSADIQFYNWDFGDGTTSTLENPSHAFTTPGTYEVILSVTDANPCDNFIRKSISIYEDPVGTFDSPGGLTCTNQPITFTNTTPDNFEGNETFEWQVDGNIVSTDRDLDYEFLSGGTFEIKLTTSIPGCSNQTIDNFDVVAGPTPDFTVTDNCVGTQFQFVNTTTGSNITSYTWDFDNGFMSTDQNPQPFEYSQPGIYNVTLTTINAAGCETSIEKSLTVYDLPQVSFTNDLSCEGAPTQFNDISVVANANIESWTWDFDDASSGSNSSIEQNPSHTFTSSGQFDVQLIATTTFGCIDSVEQTLNVKSGPQADFSFNRVCLGEEIQFTDESLPVPGEVITSWGWDLGGEFSDNQNPSTSFDFAIDYNVNLTVTSQNLCTNTVEKTISVNPVPDVNFEMENACSNEIVHFYDVTEADGDPVDTRSWTFDELGNASDSSVTFDFSNSGSYEVTLDITTQGGCEYQTTEAIAINQPPKASFEVNSAFGAPPFNVQFMNTSEGATTYSWSFGDQTNSTEANPQHTFEAEGSYDVELVAIDDTGCSDTTNLVMNALDPDLEIELLQVTFVNDKLILTIINNGTLIVDSLKAVVNLGDQLVLEETINRQLLPSTNPAAINHTLSLNLASRKIEYLCVTLESFIEGIDDSNDVNNTKCKNFESQIVFVNPFPNPAKGVLNINVLSEISGAGSIRLISSLGKTVETTSFDGVRGKNEIAMDVSHIKNGIYLLEVGMAGQNFTTRVAINN